MKKSKHKKPQILLYEEGRSVVLDADDAPELTAAQARRLRPAKDVLPGLIGEKNTEALLQGNVRIRPVGRPKAEAPKEQITFRFDADITRAIKSMGRGYNARVEALLRDAYLS